MTILITGNLGYIGSHTAAELVENGYEDIIGVDNLSVGLISNAYGIPTFIEDIRNKEKLRDIFKENKIDLVLHFASLTSVPDSMKKKDEYEDVIVNGTETLLEVMQEFGCNNLIFSSTASVYEQSQTPVKETDPLQPLNNYAKFKHEVEKLLKANAAWLNCIVFRYFNVIGYGEWYDKSNEMSKTNLVPALLKCHESGDKLKIFGNSYPVKRKCVLDKTAVRDYIDVRDIAKAYIKAIDYLKDKGGQHLFNLGTKDGSSVYELYEAFNKANGTNIDAIVLGPRQGDPASVVADNRKAAELLGWRPTYTLEQSLKVL